MAARKAKTSGKSAKRRGKAPQKTSYHHGDLRNALMKAGKELLREVGPAGFSLRDVARRADVSHMAPYRHFENRSALLAALAVEGFLELRDEMHAAAAEFPEEPRRQLASSGVRYVKLALREPERLKLMFGGVLTPEDYTEEQRQMTRESFGGLIHIIQNGQAAGAFRDDDPMTLSLAAWSLVHGLAMLLGTGHLLSFQGPDFDEEQLLHRINAVFAEGILKH